MLSSVYSKRIGFLRREEFIAQAGRDFQCSAIMSAYPTLLGPEGRRLSVTIEGEICLNNPGIPGWEEEEGRRGERNWNTAILGGKLREMMGDEVKSYHTIHTHTKTHEHTPPVTFQKLHQYSNE